MKRLPKKDKRSREAREIDGLLHYRCRGCKKWLPVGEFAALKRFTGGCGVNSRCKLCVRADDAARHRAKRAERGPMPRPAARDKAVVKKQYKMREARWKAKRQFKDWKPPAGAGLPVLISKRLEDYTHGPYGGGAS